MQRPLKSTDVSDRMGVYKRLDDVPSRYRLYQHAGAYDGRDIWAEYVAHRLESNSSDRFEENIKRAGQYWKEHMEERGRHHALAEPDDVEVFFVGLLDDMKISTVYQPYFNQVRQFFNHLLWRREYPHVYNPVLMAANCGGVTGEVFNYKINRNDKRDND